MSAAPPGWNPEPGTPWPGEGVTPPSSHPPSTGGGTQEGTPYVVTPVSEFGPATPGVSGGFSITQTLAQFSQSFAQVVADIGKFSASIDAAFADAQARRDKIEAGIVARTQQNMRDATNSVTGLIGAYTDARTGLTDFSSAASGATVGFANFIGYCKAADTHIGDITQRIDDATAKVIAQSAVLQKLSAENEGMANRAASFIANMRDSIEAGTSNMLDWTVQFNNWKDSIDHLIKINPGTQVAKQLEMVLQAFERLRLEVSTGMIKKKPQIEQWFGA